MTLVFLSGIFPDRFPGPFRSIIANRECTLRFHELRDSKSNSRKLQSENFDRGNRVIILLWIEYLFNDDDASGEYPVQVRNNLRKGNNWFYSGWYQKLPYLYPGRHLYRYCASEGVVAFVWVVPSGITTQIVPVLLYRPGSNLFGDFYGMRERGCLVLTEQVIQAFYHRELPASLFP